MGSGGLRPDLSSGWDDGSIDYSASFYSKIHLRDLTPLFTHLFYLLRSRQVLERFELLGWWGDKIEIPPRREVWTGRKEFRICLNFSSSDLGNVISVWSGIPSMIFCRLVSVEENRR